MPVEVAGVRVPVGRAAESAQTVCAEYADEALYHHCARSYFFGAAWARARGLDSDFDRELAGLGWPAERRDRTAELIVLHMRDDVAPEVDLESRLLQVGTSADVSGTGLEAFAPSFVDTLVGAYPRQGFAHSFVRLFKDQAERKPGCAAAELVAGEWTERTSSHALDKRRRV
ncbi:cyanamide hydratase [Streptomyces niveus]